MSAYGLNIPQIMAWTMPQLRLLARYRDLRERAERKWQLALAVSSQSEEGVESLQAQLDGDDVQVMSSGAQTTGGGATSSRQSHTVDSKGNVRADGPLLSDIALGKAPAPTHIPIRVIDKSEDKEEDDA